MSNDAPTRLTYLTIAQAAEESGFCYKTIYRALVSEDLRGYQRGRKTNWRISRPDLEAWITGGAIAPPSLAPTPTPTPKTRRPSGRA